jgi:zinc ribbon protein
MDVGAILLVMALLLGVALFLAAPLIANRAARPRLETTAISSLLAERDRVITSLQELDFDYKLGKIPEEDYPTQRTDLLQRGAEILRKLDALQDSPLTAAQDPSSRLEQAAAAGRADGGSTAVALEDEKIESMLAARRAARRTKSAGFCPRCGKSVLITDQFCPNCGKALT